MSNDTKTKVSSDQFFNNVLQGSLSLCSDALADTYAHWKAGEEDFFVYGKSYTPVVPVIELEEAPACPQQATACNWVNKDGNPAGGSVSGPGFACSWQNGPVGDGRKTGAFVEDLIGACTQRLRFYQDSRFACEENAEALDALTDALTSLDRRTAERIERSVEGTYEV